MLLAAVIGLVFLTIVQARDHHIVLYANEQFRGPAVDINIEGPGAVRHCNTLGREWRRRVSSVNTKEHCFELYDGLKCKEKRLYLYPGVPNHNKLADYGWNNRLQSFRLCDLDEEKVENEEGCPQGTLCRRSLDPRRPEKGFWEYFLRAWDNHLWQEFQRRVRDGAFYIWWNFIPGISGSKGQQYQAAVEWVIDLADGGNIDRAFMEGLRRRAYQVMRDRDDLNRRYGTDTAIGRVHLSVARLWRELVNTLDAAINRTYQDDDRDEEF